MNCTGGRELCLMVCLRVITTMPTENLRPHSQCGTFIQADTGDATLFGRSNEGGHLPIFSRRLNLTVRRH